MKFRWNWSRILMAVAMVTLLVSGSILFAAKGGKGGGKPGGGEVPPPVLQYQYVPLGTLGGPRSAARDLNDLGEVVGRADIADGTQHAFFYTNRFTLASGFALWDLNDLIDEPGCVLTSAHGVNESGQIVGDGEFNGALRGFIYSPPTVINEGTPEEISIPYSLVKLDDPTSGGETYADDINELGDVAAQFVTPTGDSRLVVRLSDGTLVETGVARPLGPPVAIDLNGSIASWVSSPDPLILNQAFVFDLPTATSLLLPLLGNPDAECSNISEANDINSFGEVAGQSSVGLVATGRKGKNAFECGGTHAFRYSPISGMQDLGTLGGRNSFSEAINDNGEVVGSSATSSGGASHIFLYSDSDINGDGNPEGMIDVTAGTNLPAELDGISLTVRRVNNNRVICGWTGTAAFLLIPVTP